MTIAEHERVPEIRVVTPALEEKLERMWESPPGLRGWLSTVDHKEIGIMYLVTAFAFLVAGGLEALVIRLQLAGPNQHLVTPEQYNELFSMHGTTMIFWYSFPILSGFSNYFWPLLLGSRDMAFPRVNAFSYWVFLASGLFLYCSFLVGAAPNDGWFNYPPYASREYNPGPNIDFYLLGLIFFGISLTAGGINFVVTTLRTRCPGMSVNRFPIVVWGTLSANAAGLLAVPTVSIACLMLWMDRQFGTHFFSADNGGQPLLWQHLFWMFAHPWVYMIVLPAMGIVSDALPVFCRRPLVGYTAVALSTVVTMMIGFGVWVHHMFATGLPSLGMSFFAATSILISLPSGVQVFAWLATIWTGRPIFTAAFYFFAGFVVLFVIGGVSGFVTGSVPVDWQLTDTYWVVAHIHYVLIGINLFPVIGGVYFWFPKITGRLLNERLGKWNFWVMFVGFNLAFFPMHITGLMGMPRRVYTYPAEMGWSTLNMITTVGAFILAVGILLFFINVFVSRRRGAIAGPNPWDAPSLEWSVPSPPPPYNFAVIPSIASRHPLWEERLQEGDGQSMLDRGMVLDHHHETLAVGAIDGEPDLILKMPSESYMPVLTTICISVLFAGLVAAIWWLAIVGAVATALAVIIWLWPLPEAGQREVPADE
ncbi:MAG TPA: cytochrome c oxidase subunit I [Stellaceae bacterium]|nr:cytochrome c oxidase subunit I [Stellaceae bacterium]